MPSDLLILTASDVAATLASIPASHLLAHSARLFHTATHAPPPPSYTPHRAALPTPQHTALVMPARIPDVGTAFKVVAVPSANADASTRRAGLPASTFVLDERTGAPRAFVNARLLTAAWTAASTIFATTLIHPPRSAADTAAGGFERTVMFGAGAQARAHALLLADVYAETLRALTFVVRRRAAGDNGKRIDALVDAVRARFPRLAVASISSEREEEARRLVEQADAIITATPVTAPLFDDTRVKRGAHLVLVGS